MRLRNLPLHWKIILGMFLGVLFGFLMSNFDSTGKELISNCIKPFGTIFINALKLIDIPLILASLIKGISDLKDISKLSKMGGITITTYLITTVIAVSVGLAIVNIVKPGNSISDETRVDQLYLWLLELDLDFYPIQNLVFPDQMDLIQLHRMNANKQLQI